MYVHLHMYILQLMSASIAGSAEYTCSIYVSIDMLYTYIYVYIHVSHSFSTVILQEYCRREHLAVGEC
jgi:hypothetical protein